MLSDQVDADARVARVGQRAGRAVAPSPGRRTDPTAIPSTPHGNGRPTRPRIRQAQRPAATRRIGPTRLGWKVSGSMRRSHGRGKQEEAKLVNGMVLPRRCWLHAAQVEQKFAGTVEQLGHDAQVVHRTAQGMLSGLRMPASTSIAVAVVTPERSLTPTGIVCISRTPLTSIHWSSSSRIRLSARMRSRSRAVWLAASVTISRSFPRSRRATPPRASAVNATDFTSMINTTSSTMMSPSP
jgi:hypothetical protein